MTLTPSLYRCFNANGDLIYIGCTMRLTDRVMDHNTASAWWLSVTSITVEHFEFMDDALDAEATAIETESPRFNRQVDTPLQRAARVRHYESIPITKSRPREVAS